MTQTALTYRTNRDLFSNHYLTDHLRDTEPWNEVDEAEVREVYNEIRELYEEKRHRFNDDDYNEAQLERNFIRPIFEILDVSYEIEETVERNARRPDYGFFKTDEAADAAFDRNDFYEEAIAVADAKRWGRKLDTRGEEKRDFENPSYQIHAYLQETPTTWAVLTNGQKWRLYYGPTSHRLDSYYEIDLPTLLQHVEEGGGLEEFKDFYLFFRKDAFVEDTTGSSFLDDVYEESSVFAEALGEDLQDNIYEAIRVLAEGFLDTNDELDEDDLELIHDSSLIYLYRLIFVLYAESEGRDLLPTDNPIYRESYSLNNLKQTVAENRDETQQHYQSWQTNLWDRLEELFVLIDQGSHGKGIPKDDLYIPAYNGGLFRTDPDPDDSDEAQFLANHEAGDAYLAEVIDLLTRRKSDEGEGQVFVDYSSLDERHLGSIYEGLLEYKLDVAEEPLTIENGEYTPASDGESIEVATGEVYLRTDAGERKATGSYYTPEYVVEYIVDQTLDPLVSEISEDLLAQDPFDKEGGGQFAEDFADRIFDLKILDPAMGSGHFLVNAVDYLAREIIDAQERQDQQAVQAGNEEKISEPRTEEGELRDINWARRKVAQRCIYGVDLNPLATELAKVSLWLRTLAAEQPLAFLDHHLKTGNSLVGSDIEEVLEDGDTDGENGQLTLQQSFARMRQEALEHVMNQFQDLLSIDNETLEDIKEMEEVYEEVRDDPLYQHLLGMANVHTAQKFGLDMPVDAHEQMAEAMRDNRWEKIEQEDWYRSAQAVAGEEKFFHWSLEFPVVFYDEEGRKRPDAGFDAVIGNPPYLTLGGKQDVGASEELKDYTREEYSSAEYKINTYALFYEKGIELSNIGGEISFIVPRAMLDNHHLGEVRQLLSNQTKIRQIMETKYDVFGQAETGRNAIGIFQKASSEDIENEISFITIDNSENFKNRVFNGDKVDQTYITKESNYVFTYQGSERRKLISRLQEEQDQFGEYISVNNGVNTGNAADVLISNEKESENHREFIEGKDVNQYHISWRGLWINYDPSLKSRLDPADLDTRQDHVDFSLRSPEIFDNEKIVIRQTADSLIGAYDDEGFVSRHSTHLLLPKDDLDVSLKFILAIFNSRLLTYTYRSIIPEEGKTFAEVKAVNVEKLPIPNLSTWPTDSQPSMTEERALDHLSTFVDHGKLPEFTDCNSKREKSKTHDLLVSLVGELSSKKEVVNEINTAIEDYIHNYEFGPRLDDLHGYQPAKSVSQSILAENAEQREKLRVGDVTVEESSSKVVIHLTARYKPENPEDYETDRWGYTETEPIPAMEFVGLDELEKALIKQFVPHAVDQASGFANFRENATKSKSLVDRLKALQLPVLNDIEEDLKNYLESKGRAERLQDEITAIEEFINNIVYQMYELEQEEIDLIESTKTDST